MANNQDMFAGRVFQNSPNFGKDILGRDCTKELLEIKTDQSPLLAILNSKQVKSKPTTSLKFEHYSQRMTPVSFRINANITAAATTFTVDPSTAAMLTPQTIVQNSNTKETMEVVSRDTTTGVVTVKRGVGVSDEAGNTIAPAPATTLHTFLVLSTLVKEGVGTMDSYALVPDHHENNIGMYQTDLDMSELAITQAVIADDGKALSNLRKWKMMEHKNKLEQALWFSPRIFEQTGSGLKASTGGIEYYLTDSPNNALLTTAVQNSFEDSLMAIGDVYRKISYYGQKNNIFAFGGYRFKNFLAKIAMKNDSNSFQYNASTTTWGGYDVSQLNTPYGQLKFVYSPLFDTMDVGGNDSVAASCYLLNMQQIWLRPFGAYGMGSGLVYHGQYDNKNKDMKGIQEYYYSNLGLQMGYKEAHAKITLQVA